MFAYKTPAGGWAFPSETDSMGRRVADVADRGCWALSSDGGPLRFVNQYYQEGEVLREADVSTTIPQVVGQTGGPKFVCLKVDVRFPPEADPSVVALEGIDELQEAQRDEAFVITPLYLVRPGTYEVVADLRNVPEIQKSEVF